MTAARDDRPVCETCGTRPAIPGVQSCLRCLDQQILDHQAALDAGGRRR